METHIVIMAGGIGSRFWPMSTPECPKQFIDVTGCGKSLIQLTVERFKGLCIPDNIWIVTSDKYKETVRKQLPSVPPHHILTEPVARNTAPCITYACWKIKKHHPHANIVVTPADALVINTDEFRRVIATTHLHRNLPVRPVPLAARVPRCCTMPGNVHTICIFYLLQYATQAVLSMRCRGSRGKFL